jgi:hypothetical protein
MSGAGTMLPGRDSRNTAHLCPGHWWERQHGSEHPAGSSVYGWLPYMSRPRCPVCVLLHWGYARSTEPLPELQVESEPDDYDWYNANGMWAEQRPAVAQPHDNEAA